tara:strand:+ start:112274 stop:112771 length:498 start_codon:yes stop_codon:yes gene_type:complete
MMPPFCAILSAILVAGSAQADTDFSAMTAAERQVFETELRAAILAAPEIVAQALAQDNPAAGEMRQYIDDDLALLTRLAPRILSGNDLALVVRGNCPDCARAQSEIQDISNTSGASFILHDLDDPEVAAWAAELRMDEAPFYVLPQMILRGHMPAVVLLRYLGAE